jgi:hypothetical protein
LSVCLAASAGLPLFIRTNSSQFALGAAAPDLPDDIIVQFTRQSVDSAIGLPLLYFGEVTGVSGVDVIAEVGDVRKVVTLESGTVGLMFSVCANAHVRVSVNHLDSGRLRLCHDNEEDFEVGTAEALFATVKLCEPLKRRFRSGR